MFSGLCLKADASQHEPVKKLARLANPLSLISACKG
jgi:hypothetical protein